MHLNKFRRMLESGSWKEFKIAKPIKVHIGGASDQVRLSLQRYAIAAAESDCKRPQAPGFCWSYNSAEQVPSKCRVPRRIVDYYGRMSN